MVAPGLKARYVDVYLPSQDVKQQWAEEASKSGIPLSKYVFEAVEAFRASKKETPRSDFIKELAEAKEELQKLHNALKLKNLLLEKLQSEIYRARYDSFKEIQMDEGTRRHDEDLIRALRRGKPLDGYAILNELGVDPRDTEAVKLVNNQLESLRRFGLVEETANGWRWIK